MSRLTELLGLDHPIVLGPFGGGLSSIELAAAVSNAGGLGSFGAQHLSPDELTETVEDLREATGRAFNVNLWVSTHDVPEERSTGTRPSSGCGRSTTRPASRRPSARGPRRTRSASRSTP